MKMLHKLSFVLALTLLPSGVAAQDAPVGDPTDTPQTPVTADVPKQSAEDRVVFLLSGYEYFPTRADLDEVGPASEIAAILRGLATNDDGRPTQRLRAVDALGYYDDAETLALLTNLATTTPKTDLPRRKLRTAGLLQHHAITSLARATKSKSVPVLEPVLMGDDVQLTLTTIHALAKHAGKDGLEALRRLLDESQNKIVVREARKWLR